MKAKRVLENGQALVLIVIAVMGLFAFIALAIDGGTAYFDRRRAQSAADAASLAGAWETAQYWKDNNISNANCPPPTDIINSRIFPKTLARAASNGYQTDLGSGVSVSPSITCEGRNVDVHVQISAPTKTTFIHFFYSGDVRNTVTAVAQVIPKHTIGFGAALASLSPLCGNPGGQTADLSRDGGIRWAGGGNGHTYIKDGGIFSNSCLNASGQPDIVAYTGSDPLNSANYAASGTIAYHWPTGTGLTGSTTNFTNTHPYPVHSDFVLQPVSFQPKCMGNVKSSPNNGDYNSHGGTYTLSPGRYNGINVPNQKTLVLEAGLYCITGDFNVSAGGKLTQNPANPPGTNPHEGITIYMINGKFDASGSPEVHLYASSSLNAFDQTNYNNNCTSDIDPNCAIPGLLLYSPAGNKNQINMGGSGTFSYIGTVYAPEGWVSMGGSNDSTCVANGTCLYGTEVIAWVIVLNGNNYIDIDYNGYDFTTIPSNLSQYQ